jgi:hypothetical protein
MQVEINNINNKFTVIKQDYKNKLSCLNDTINKIINTETTLSNLKDLLDLANQTNINLQIKTSGVVEELVTKGLQAIFHSEMFFKIEHVIKRNQPEVYFYIEEYGHRYEFDINDEQVGGGLTVFTSFILRIVLWSLIVPRSIPVFLLDEPLTYLSKDKLMEFGNFLKYLVNLLNIQIIFVTHEDELRCIADRVFKVNREKGISYVEQE